MTPRATALLVMVGLLLALLVPAAPAQDVSRAQARLVVTDLSGIVGPGVDPDADESPDLDVRLLVENTSSVDVDDLQVVVEVYEAVGGARSVLQETLDTQSITGRLLALRRPDVRGGGTVGPDDLAGVRVSVPGSEIGWEGSNDVYPVQVSVVLGTQVLDRVVTAVVHLAEPPERPLQTSVVWPIDAPTRRTATGRYEQAVPDELQPGGRIDRLLTALERHPDAPVLVAPGTVLVEELADRANGFQLPDGTAVAADAEAALRAGDLLERLRGVMASTPLDPVIGPYGRAHLAALAQGPEPIAAMSDLAVDAARNRVQALLERAPDLDLFLATTPVTPDVLEGLNAEHVLVPWDQVVGPDLATHPNLPHAAREVAGIRGPGAARRATVADPHVAAVLTDPPVESGSVIAQQRLMAETALLYLVEPGTAGRALLVQPPVHWEPQRGATGEVLDALLASPWIELGRPGDAAPTDPGVLRPPDAVLSPGLAEDVRAAQQRMDALREAMPQGPPDLGSQSVSDLEDALLRALTPEALAGDASEARAEVGRIRNVVEEAFGTVSLASGAGVTLTSATGDVPITVERTAGAAIEVVVEVQSSNALRWTDDTRTKRLTLPEGASRTVAFNTRALSRGRFPVTVTVWDPTQDKLLDSTTLSVRSTAISRTALLVIGGVVLLLLLGGLRRRRSPQLEVVR